MPSNNPSRRNLILLVLLLLTQMLLMSGDVKGGRGTDRVESFTMGITSPIVAAAQWVSGSIRGVWVGGRELIQAHGRGSRLDSELQRLQSEVQLSREAVMENQRLRRLLRMRDERIPQSIGATIVTTNLTSHTKIFVVDRGREDGVRPDLPVVAWNGAVGRVMTTEQHYSKVLLITDPNSGVAGVTQRGRAQGVVLGQPLRLAYVKRFSDVVRGDRVVTSGLDGVFPKGFALARVASVESDPSGTQTILLDPEVDFASQEEVLILLESAAGPAQE